jgi:hypothetical protein
MTPTPEQIAHWDAALDAAVAAGTLPKLIRKLVPADTLRAGTFLREMLVASGVHLDYVDKICEAFCKANLTAGALVYDRAIELVRTSLDGWRETGWLPASAKPCEACPFNDGLTDAASQVQNYGCLPTPGDNIRTFDKTGQSIGCHNGTGHCLGLLQHRPQAVLCPVLTYEQWYQQSIKEPSDVNDSEINNQKTQQASP